MDSEPSPLSVQVRFDSGNWAGGWCTVPSRLNWDPWQGHSNRWPSLLMLIRMGAAPATTVAVIKAPMYQDRNVRLVTLGLTFILGTSDALSSGASFHCGIEFRTRV